MRILGLAVVLVGAVAGAQGIQCAGAKAGDWSRLKIVNTAPTEAKNFGAALSLGNGRLGAKLMGEVAAETVYLNDTTLWSGGPEHFEDAKAKVAFEATRAALAKGDYGAADALARGMEGPNNESYVALGALHLRFDGTAGYTDYRNVLDLSTAVATTQYRVGGVGYTREMFVSYPAQVVVVRITSDKVGALGFTASLDTLLHSGTSEAKGNEMRVTGRAPVHVDNYGKKGLVEWKDGRGMGMEEILRVSVDGGTVTAGKDGLTVAGATTATLLVSAATSFNGFDKDPGTQGKDAGAIAKGYMAKAAGMSYEALLRGHLADFEGLFRRVWLEVNGDAGNKYALAYQWARYALIEASRPGGGAPRNEQGIWNRELTPAYASNFTLNENPEKYYSVAEVGNVGETTDPLTEFMGGLAKNGAITARVNYGFHGWVAHHNTDIWAMTTMSGGDPAWADWPMGGIWLCQSLWEHYAFGLDKTYLREKAYPVMKGAAEFALDLLVEDGKGHLVTSPSSSPENHFTDPASGKRVAVSRGSTMDLALIRELFGHVVQAGEVLGVDAEFRGRVRAAMARILPYQIGAQGQLQEWSEDFKEWEPTHRHASHVVAVWPLAQITADQPELFAAARRSLELRGTGGYHPDKAGMWARLGDGDRALAAIRSTGFPALFDAPMGGVAEMLVQSQTGRINLLPALPTSWKSGEVKGLRARGNYEVDVKWAEGKVTEATVRSFGGTVPVVEIGGVKVAAGDPRVKVVMGCAR